MVREGRLMEKESGTTSEKSNGGGDGHRVTDMGRERGRAGTRQRKMRGGESVEIEIMRGKRERVIVREQRGERTHSTRPLSAIK